MMARWQRNDDDGWVATKTIMTTMNDKRQRQRQTTPTALVKEKRKTKKKKRVILSLSLQVYKREVSQAGGIYLYSRGRLPSHPTLPPSIHPILSIHPIHPIHREAREI